MNTHPREWNRGIELDASTLLLLEVDVGRATIKAKADRVQLLFKNLLVSIAALFRLSGHVSILNARKGKGNCAPHRGP